MPELPEVETIKLGLQKLIVGKTIKNVDVRKAKIFVGDPKEVIGKKIESVERRGKILIINLSGGISILIHFKLSGQIVWIPHVEGESVTLGHPVPFAGTELPAKTTHVIFDIDGGKLFYNDLRQFGWIRVIRNIGDIGKIKEINKMGPEPFDKEFTVEYLKKVFNKTSKPIKLVLLDQEKIAGIGNIYANDALFEAGIMPTKPAKQLSDLAIKQLKKAIIKVLKEGIKYGGSSAKDEAYIKPNGEPGGYQNHFRVYQRNGQKCRKCDGIVKRMNLGGRGTFYCEKCQA